LARRRIDRKTRQFRFSPSSEPATVRGKTTISVPGVGMSRARSIFFEALGMLTPGSGFLDLRQASVHAANSLYNPTIAAAVSAAWAAVGVVP